MTTRTESAPGADTRVCSKCGKAAHWNLVVCRPFLVPAKPPSSTGSGALK
jgi:hypothetical protein